jgi:hypothetical protein
VRNEVTRSPKVGIVHKIVIVHTVIAAIFEEKIWRPELGLETLRLISVLALCGWNGCYRSR